jgi:hypothetical protein
LRPRLRLAAVAAVLLTLAGVATAAPAHAASGYNSYCIYPSGSLCMNRAGGGTSQGTHIIGWPRDTNASLDSFYYNNYVCGTYETVHNGEGGCVGPFANGSGLNARYDTDHVVYLEFDAASSGQPIGCIGQSSEAYAVLYTGCVPSGGAFVVSNTNGAFLISVGVSNYWYTNGGGSNRPYWLVAGSQGQQLYFCQCASNSWGVVGP